MKNTMLQADFQNFIFTDGDQKTFCYRTGAMVYEEVFRAGRLMSAGWNAAGYTLNVLDDFPTRFNNDLFREPQAFDLEINGMSLAWDYDFESAESFSEPVENRDETRTHVIIRLKSRLVPVRVEIHTLLDGTSCFERFLKVENLSDAPLNVNSLAVLSGGLEQFDGWEGFMEGAPDPEKIYSLGYMSRTQALHEGSFMWHALPNAEYAVSGKYQLERHRHPMFILHNNLLGSTFICNFAWTGGFKFDFLLDAETPVSNLSYKVELASQKPLLILRAGETFEFPHAHIGLVQGDLDAAVNAMHRHLRRSVFTLPSVDGVYGWVEGGMGPERLMDVKASKHFIDTIAAVGGETFIIDAGWYCPLGKECQEWWTRTGDWYPDAERYPNGIKEVRDYAHEKGLKFGLWIETERIGNQSRVAEEHPDWFMKLWREDGETSVLDMAKPEVAAWVESELERCINEYGMELFRLDYNMGVDGLLGRHEGESVYLRYYQNVYAMYGRLKRKYPGVIFENCASGGGRTDVGFVKDFTHTWVSDWNVAPRALAITNGMTMALPPEWVDRLVGGMNCHTRASLAFQARTAIFGRPTTNDYNAVGTRMNPAQIETVKRTFDLYKTYIRPYIEHSLIFHHTPALLMDEGVKGYAVEQPHGVGILERASEYGEAGVIGVFSLADDKNQARKLRVYPKGIDMGRDYRVLFDNSGDMAVVSGYTLQNEGIRVSLGAAMTSELIVYKAI